VSKRWDAFVMGLVGMVAGLMVAAMVPALAAAVGDPLALGQVNRIDERTDWKGDANGAVVQVKNTGSSSAVAAKADRQTIVAKATSGPVALNARADRVAVKIRVDADEAPIKVNASAGTATNLSADLLDGRHADGLTRVAFSNSGNLPNGDQEPFLSAGGFGDVLVTNLTAPTAGFLVITATVDAVDTSSFVSLSCHLRVDGIGVAGTLMIGEINGDQQVNEDEDCTTHGVAEVGAGDHTISLRLDTLELSTDLGEGSLSAVFVPFDGTGSGSGL
jgi:hypothetical protein